MREFWDPVCPRCGTPYPERPDPWALMTWFEGHACLKREEKR